MSLRSRVRAVAFCMVLCCWFGQPGGAQPEKRYEAGAPHTVMVPMRDGVKLATDVYLPNAGGAAAEGKFPVIMERTPYNKDAAVTAARELVPHGYAVVVQD